MGTGEKDLPVVTDQQVKTCGKNCNCGKHEEKKAQPDLVGDRKDHILNRHRNGAGKPGKTEFPPDWTDEVIIEATNTVANDPNIEPRIGDHNSPVKKGTVNGVVIEVYFYPNDHRTKSGKVSTAYPTNTTANPPAPPKKP